MAYRYWVLRYVPDPVRGEFVNIGVVVGDGEDDWAIRKVSSFARASRLGGDAQRAEEWLWRIERRFSPHEFHLRVPGLELEGRPTVGWLNGMHVRAKNAVQVSEPAPVFASSAAKAADTLFQTLVVEADHRSGAGRRRGAAVRSLREAFWRQEWWTPRAMQSNVKLKANHQSAQFEFALGERRIAQLSRVQSFDVASPEAQRQQIQAWSYAVKVFRSKGGQVINARRKDPVTSLDRDVPIRVLYIPPVTPAQEEIFAIAQDAWADLEVRALPVGSEDQIANEVGALVM